MTESDREQIVPMHAGEHILVCAGLAIGVIGAGAFFFYLRRGRRNEARMAYLLETFQRIGAGEDVDLSPLHEDEDMAAIERTVDAVSMRFHDARLRLRQETDERIAAIERLRIADRLATVGRLAAGIAHELGTPLNVVQGRAGQIVEHDLPEALIRKNARVIEQQVTRMTAVVRQLLEFARGGAACYETTDVAPLIQSAVDLVSPFAHDREVRLVYEPIEFEAVADVDAGKIQQLLTNLLVNAVHASHAGGSVHVDACRNLRPQCNMCITGACKFQGTEALRIEVRDSGRGISKEHLARVFEPFFTTREVGEGSGLGLSIAHGIAREHGGCLEVESEPGAGSCFTFFLPGREEHPCAQAC